MDDQSRKQGSQKVGSLIPRIVATQRIVDGTDGEYPTKPKDSGTTTPQSKHLAATGTHPGEHGSSSLTSSRHATEVVATASLGTLHRDPARLLPQCVRSSIAATWGDFGDEKYGWDGRVVGYEMTAPVSEDEISIAIEVTEASLRPISEQAVIAELGRLRTLTVSRDVGEDLSFVFAAYADELMRYPADAVRDVLRMWPKQHRFWPAMAELTELLDPLVKPRHALREALRRGYRDPEVSPDWIPPPSEEDKAAVVALLAEHGYAVDHTGRVRPPEVEPMTAEERKRVADETAAFRLPDEDDPRVQARLREMGVE